MRVSSSADCGEYSGHFHFRAATGINSLKLGGVPLMLKVAFLALFALAVAGSLPAVAAPNYPADATYVGSEVCAECHVDATAEFERTLMGRIFMKNPRNHQEKLGCEGCHGPGSLHVEEGGGRGVGGIVGYGKESEYPVSERNAICQSCHQGGKQLHWTGGTHESRGLACTNCHSVMKKTSAKNQFAKKTEIETCYQCHKLKRAQMQRSAHMPVREGKMTCSSCHNPHGSFNEKMLQQTSVNETCYTCHAEKRGPFLWEHAPVRENCTTCHDPHGSNHYKMLKVARPRLCAQCHSEGSHPGGLQDPTNYRAIGRSCLNCHTQIHGSNHPAGVRLQR